MIDDEDALYNDSPETDEARPAGKQRKRRAIDGRLRNTFRVMRDHHRRQSAAARLPCGICGQRLDYSLKHGDSGAHERDHIKPVETHPHLALVESNFQPSHAVFNKRKALLLGPDGDAADDGDGDTAVAVFVISGRRVEYGYSKDPGPPSEPW